MYHDMCLKQVSYKYYSSAVMARCWYVDPKERPGFSDLCSITEQFLSLISDYAELKMVLVEDVNGRCLNTLP